MKKLLLLVFFVIVTGHLQGREINLKAGNTISAVEMDKGDIIHFTLKNERNVNLELVECKTNIIFTTLDTLKKGSNRNATIYSMTCKVRIDGQLMEMVRYVPVQQSFYEPYVVNGLRIWFDALGDLNTLFNENHGKCVPLKDARFVLQDATLPICPVGLSNWFPIADNFIDVYDCYGGEDTWLGTYFGSDLHGGLDIDMPINTPLCAPLDFDVQYYFNSLEGGHNNNRWRGIKYWDNGDIWTLQTHHLIDLLVPEYQGLEQGITYAHAAGVLSGYAPHTHFVFKIKQKDKESILIDPWILFWQIFRNNKKKAGAIIANIEPVKPAKTGETVFFKSTGCRAGVTGNGLQYYWTFGDGGFSVEKDPQHIYQNAGIYPVSLIVFDGTAKELFTQHITVNGEQYEKPGFSLVCEDETGFIRQPSFVMNTYGATSVIPHSVHFTAFRKSQFKPLSKVMKIKNFDKLNWKQGHHAAANIRIDYKHGHNWLNIEKKLDSAEPKVVLTPVMENVIRRVGQYEAFLYVSHEDAINSQQVVRIVLTIAENEPDSIITIDNQNENCYSSPSFWLSPRFRYEWFKSYGRDFLINASNEKDQFVRYTPELTSGIYEIELTSPAFQQPELKKNVDGFYVKVKHKNGMDKIWMDPLQNFKVGEFEFNPGRDGYVEIVTNESKGLIIADAVIFKLKNKVNAGITNVK